MCLKPEQPKVQKPNTTVQSKDVEAEATTSKDKQKELAAKALGWQRTIGTGARGTKGLLS